MLVDYFVVVVVAVDCLILAKKSAKFSNMEILVSSIFICYLHNFLELNCV